MKYTPMMAAAAFAVALIAVGQTAAGPAKKAAAKTAKAKASPEKKAAEPKAAKIADLLREPKAYAGKEVSVRGTFSGICCESDWFLKDGVDSIEVYSTKMCPMPSKSKIRSKVTVIGTVIVRGDHPAITAKDLRFE